MEVVEAPGNPSMIDYMAIKLADGMKEREVINNSVGDLHLMDVFSKMDYQRRMRFRSRPLMYKHPFA